MRLLHVSTAVPSFGYSTEELMKLFPCELSEETRKNVLNLGVSKRYFVYPINFSDKSELILNDRDPIVNICAEACEKAMNELNLNPSHIDYLIVTYDCSAFLCPGLSAILLRKVGFNPYVRHVSVQGMTCTAFMKALQIAQDYLTRFPKNRVMICLSGANSYLFYNQVRGLKHVMGIREIQALRDENVRRRELLKWIATLEFFLFGDGAACIVVANEGDGLQVLGISNVSNINESDYLVGYARLTCANEPFKFGFHSYLDKELPNCGLTYSSLAVKRLFEKEGAKLRAKVKKWAVHTGSKRILDKIAQRNGLTYEMIRESYTVLTDYGNLSGASLPFILEQILREGKLDREDNIVLLGFGWGFTSDACMLSL